MCERILQRDFPGLRTSDFKLDSPCDKKYNCFAWAAGFSNLWWEPIPFPIPGYYWPRPPRRYDIQEYLDILESFGYSRCKSPDKEEGYQKVVIYVNDAGAFKHIARQEPSGQWTSKCGNGPDIMHELDGLEGSLYGKAKIFMKRRVG